MLLEWMRIDFVTAALVAGIHVAGTNPAMTNEVARTRSFHS